MRSRDVFLGITGGLVLCYGVLQAVGLLIHTFPELCDQNPTYWTQDENGNRVEVKNPTSYVAIENDGNGRSTLVEHLVESKPAK